MSINGTEAWFVDAQGQKGKVLVKAVSTVGFSLVSMELHFDGVLLCMDAPSPRDSFQVATIKTQYLDWCVDCIRRNGVIRSKDIPYFIPDNVPGPEPSGRRIDHFCPFN
jgi:hypothetical protein